MSACFGGGYSLGSLWVGAGLLYIELGPGTVGYIAVVVLGLVYAHWWMRLGPRASAGPLVVGALSWCFLLQSLEFPELLALW